ncbi:MAG: glycerophosphodiester phosphodiesterase family protein [Anaerolineales bacterium]|jgi:glycerophosphoryl diester phosphodiesterase
MFSKIPQPAIFAHRGASAHAPENTLASFELAVRQKADAIELDAKLSADGQVVVIHDQTVDRTTDGSGRVNQMTLAQLRQLDAGIHFAQAFHGERIPTLEEVFDAVGRKIFINVELTNYSSLTDSLPEKVADLVHQHNLDSRVMFSSFNPLALLRAHRRVQAPPIGLLAQQGRPGAWARSWLGRIIGYNSLNPELSDVNLNLVENSHRRGKRVLVYTVNQAEDMLRMYKLKVDGIFTDYPDLARQVRNTLKQ